MFRVLYFVTLLPSLYLVGVVHPEDVSLKFLGVCSRVALLHHGVKGFFGNSSVRMHLQEVLILSL